MEAITQLGVGGIFAVLIIKMVFDFVDKYRQRKNGSEYSKMCTLVKETKELTQKIFDMHNRTDEDGVYVWYIRRSLEEAIKSLADNVNKQTNVFERLILRLEEDFRDRS